jgi:hypothetical protein
MKKIVLFGLGLLVTGALYPAETVASKWAAIPPEIDGRFEDWQGEAMVSQKSVGVELALRNDGDNLYILFIFKNPKYVSSVEMTGLTLYAASSGKKDKDHGVRFIKRTVDGKRLTDYMEKQGKPMSEKQKREIIDKPQFVVFEATAVNKKGQEIFPAGATPDVDLPGFRYVKMPDQVVYELRVPLCSREVHPAGIGAAPGETLKLGFEWGGMTEEMRAAARGRGGGMTGADMTGERSTGSYDGRVPDVAKGPPKHSFWLDVALAAAVD